MTATYLSPEWHAFVLALGNHLWQSTLVAIAAGLLTLALRKHHARARYWLWFAASMKFLAPFSLLVAIGNSLAWHRPETDTAKTALYFAIEEISQPFTQASARVTAPRTSSILQTGLTHLIPWIAAVWLCGFLAVLLLWTARWFRISRAIRSAVPLSEGREVYALRRLEHLGGIRRPIAFLLSRASLEPGIFGISRPMLIWPEGISKRLEDAHLDAILAHEVWHVRRRDNLAAALHMLVEAVFWFHPLVWWLGSRLVEERERACDEEVVALGSDRQVYAESILKVCEFCLGSPLPCVAGVTGADLKKRMVHIMNDRILHNLGLGRKLLLTTAATLAIAIPVTFGLLNATPSRAQAQDATIGQPAHSFESVSIKPGQSPDTGMMNRSKIMFNLNDGSLTARGVPLQMLIKLAYHVQDSQLDGGPDWINTQRFDIDARMSSADIAQLHKTMMENRGDQAMLQALLRDRFKLSLHQEVRNLPVYDLVIDKGGPKLQESNGLRTMHMDRGELVSQGTHLAFLADQLSLRLGRTVVDKTGLMGNYAFNLRWTPDAEEEARMSRDGMALPPASSAAEVSGPPLATAIQQQLGLKLEPGTDAVQVLVIDHAEQPSEN